MNEMLTYLYLPMMDYGKDRRKFIVDWFNNNPNGRYYVNCKYRPQVKEDPDLKYLIGKGFLKVKREGTRTSRNTYLVKV